MKGNKIKWHKTCEVLPNVGEEVIVLGSKTFNVRTLMQAHLAEDKQTWVYQYGTMEVNINVNHGKYWCEKSVFETE